MTFHNAVVAAMVGIFFAHFGNFFMGFPAVNAAWGWGSMPAPMPMPMPSPPPPPPPPPPPSPPPVVCGTWGTVLN